MNLFVFNTKLLKSLEYTNHLKIIVIYMLFSWVDIFKQNIMHMKYVEKELNQILNKVLFSITLFKND